MSDLSRVMSHIWYLRYQRQITPPTLSERFQRELHRWRMTREFNRLMYAKGFVESEHPREAKGQAEGGQFTGNDSDLKQRLTSVSFDLHATSAKEYDGHEIGQILDMTTGGQVSFLGPLKAQTRLGVEYSEGWAVDFNTSEAAKERRNTYKHNRKAYGNLREVHTHPTTGGPSEDDLGHWFVRVSPSRSSGARSFGVVDKDYLWLIEFPEDKTARDNIAWNMGGEQGINYYNSRLLSHLDTLGSHYTEANHLAIADTAQKFGFTYTRVSRP